VYVSVVYVIVYVNKYVWCGVAVITAWQLATLGLNPVTVYLKS